MITGNEPAHPTEVAFDENGMTDVSQQSSTTGIWKGLTIRQHFAAMNMAAMFSMPVRFEEIDGCAISAVKAADALIAELNKP